MSGIKGNAAYNRAVSDLGIFDRAFFSKAITDDATFEALSPNLHQRAAALREVLNVRPHARKHIRENVKRCAALLWAQWMNALENLPSCGIFWF
jgi:hypothetical protein